MSILGLIEVSFASAKTAIDASTAMPGDLDAAVLRVGVLEFLRVHASRVQANGGDAKLVDAYRSWLDSAVEVYATGKEDLVPEYMRRAGLLTAELELAEARADGRLGPATPSTQIAGGP
jgi:hypothetical protein